MNNFKDSFFLAIGILVNPFVRVAVDMYEVAKGERYKLYIQDKIIEYP